MGSPLENAPICASEKLAIGKKEVEAEADDAEVNETADSGRVAVATAKFRTAELADGPTAKGLRCTFITGNKCAK